MRQQPPARLQARPANGNFKPADISGDTRVNDLLSANAHRGGLIRIDQQSIKQWQQEIGLPSDIIHAIAYFENVRELQENP